MPAIIFGELNSSSLTFKGWAVADTYTRTFNETLLQECRESWGIEVRQTFSPRLASSCCQRLRKQRIRESQLTEKRPFNAVDLFRSAVGSISLSSSVCVSTDTRRWEGEMSLDGTELHCMNRLSDWPSMQRTAVMKLSDSAETFFSHAASLYVVQVILQGRTRRSLTQPNL